MSPIWPLEFAWSILRDQADIASKLFQDVRFRAPLLIIWVAAFGGALHDAVTSFFYLEISGSKLTVGRIYAGLSFGGLILSPVYGAWMDRRGVFWPLCAASLCCGLGCAVRGLARNLDELYIGVLILGCGAGGLFTLVLSHLSTHSPPHERTTIVSAYVFQCTTLRLLGKALFPLTNWILIELTGWEADTLPIYRAHMMSCPVFCLFGIGWLVFVDGRHLWRMSQDRIIELEQLAAHRSADSRELKALQSKPDEASSATDKAITKQPNSTVLSWFMFSVVAIVGACQSFGATSIKIVWPFFVKDNFGYASGEYGWLIFLSACITGFSIAALPLIEKRVGRFQTCLLICIVSAGACFLGFFPLWGAMGFLGTAAHVTLTVCVLGALEVGKSNVKSFAPVFIKKDSQGKSFGYVATVMRLGEIVAGFLALELYEKFQGPLVPMVAVALLLCACAALLLLALPEHVKSANSQRVSSSHNSTTLRGCHSDSDHSLSDD